MKTWLQDRRMRRFQPVGSPKRLRLKLPAAVIRRITVQVLLLSASRQIDVHRFDRAQKNPRFAGGRRRSGTNSGRAGLPRTCIGIHAHNEISGFNHGPVLMDRSPCPPDRGLLDINSCGAYRVQFYRVGQNPNPSAGCP
ncbi:hypothetical protein A6M21_14225 [Desulfotomaculum copahuensis]|uniref:Uncharacterized protein n=1 Tax=Desulfotomaculum copahuensis TaxID=1838280 RepID=A0A1B7LBQ0_9FIRM|nr:hypothetical protein A6M21_14225 [Desulfotomaculum copahuensis]